MPRVKSSAAGKCLCSEPLCNIAPSDRSTFDVTWFATHDNQGFANFASPQDTFLLVENTAQDQCAHTGSCESHVDGCFAVQHSNKMSKLAGTGQASCCASRLPVHQNQGHMRSFSRAPTVSVQAHSKCCSASSADSPSLVARCKAAQKEPTAQRSCLHSHSSQHQGHSHHAHCAHTHGHEHHHNWLTQGFDNLGVSQLAQTLQHSWIFMGLSIACFLFAFLLGIQHVCQFLPNTITSYLHTASLFGTYFLSGIPQAVESLGAAASGHIDTHVLMSLAVCGTLYMGMAQEGALLLILFQLSHFLEEKLTARAQGSLERLFASIPTQATLITLDPVTAQPNLASEQRVQAASLVPGQLVMIKPGEQVPLDGDVVWGTANLSLQHISGESHPVRMAIGSAVPAGSINTDGLLVVRVTATLEESTPSRIARMAAEAQSSKPQLSRLLDRVGAIWSRAVIGVTIACLVLLPTALGIPLLGPDGAFYRAMGVLTAGSPCAVVLVPLAYVCAVATITRKGVLVKSAAALEDLATCSTVALDKTGTITTGSLTLTDAYIVREAMSDPYYTATSIPIPAAALSETPSSRSRLDDSLSSLNESDIDCSPSLTAWNSASSLQSAASEPSLAGTLSAAELQPALHYAVALSRGSNHPVSRAMVDMHGKHAHPVQVNEFKQVPGGGVQGVCQLGSLPPVFVKFGSLEFVRTDLGGNQRDVLDMFAENQQAAGAKAMSFLVTAASGSMTASSNSTVAVFCFEDAVQPGVARAVHKLLNGRWSGIEKVQHRKQLVMLTGDHAAMAASVASSVGIQDYRASLQPQDKLAFVQSFAQRGQGLVMMGDGINDAPALAAARVGCAVANTPTDMVASVADVIILNGQGVANLPWLFHLAERTQRIIQQNLILALASVVFATVPTVAGFFPLWLAVLLHEGATVLVALNSLRLLRDPQDTSLLSALRLTAQAVMALRDQHDDDHHHHHHHDDNEHDHNHSASHCGTGEMPALPQNGDLSTAQLQKQLGASPAVSQQQQQQIKAHPGDTQEQGASVGSKRLKHDDVDQQEVENIVVLMPDGTLKLKTM